MGFREMLRRGREAAALIWLNFCIAFVVLNVVLLAYYGMRDSRQRVIDPVSSKYGVRLAEVYPGMSPADIKELLRESWTRPFIYAPFTQFKERPSRGKFVNVVSAGFRVSKNQGPWPPDRRKYITVFLFGASTTFGYGVPDDQTIASYLQERLSSATIAMRGKEARVYNFGQGSYYSTQERILFEQLLSSGFVPDMAIFIDGLGDFYFHNAPLYTEEFRALADKYTAEQAAPRKAAHLDVGQTLRQLPLGRAMVGLRERLGSRSSGARGNPSRTSVESDDAKYNDGPLLDGVIRRFLTNKRMIEASSAAFGVRPVFVWQPSPLYEYDLRYHLFASEDFGAHTYAKYGYPKLAALAASAPLGADFLWCADIQRSEREALYVDKVHYTSQFSRKVAGCIVDLMTDRRLFARIP